jgi:biopolymer transport protein ExbD
MAFYTRKRRQPQIILVSLIDVLTILLIFFVVTTTFKTADSRLDLNLPSSKRAKTIPNPQPTTALTVTVDKKIYLEGEEVSIEQLPERVKAFQKEFPDRKLALKGDKDVSYGFILEIFDALKDAGMTSLPAFTDAKKAAK